MSWAVLRKRNADVGVLCIVLEAPSVGDGGVFFGFRGEGGDAK